MKRIVEVARFTKEPARLADFYAKLLDTPAPIGRTDMFAFDVAGVILFIHPSDYAPPAEDWPDGVDHIAFEVDDLDAECRRLASRGIDVDGPSTFPWGRAAFLHDPDGRLIELVERPP